MVDPAEHGRSRGWIETILMLVPGFRGYLKREHRREADRLLRSWMEGELTAAQSRLDAGGRALIAQGQLDAMTALGEVKTVLDRLIATLRSTVQGYESFFGYVDVGVEELDDVYSHDQQTLEAVRRLSERTTAFANTPNTDALPTIADQARQIAAMLTERSRLLDGLGGTTGK